MLILFFVYGKATFVYGKHDFVYGKVLLCTEKKYKTFYKCCENCLKNHVFFEKNNLYNL